MSTALEKDVYKRQVVVRALKVQPEAGAHVVDDEDDAPLVAELPDREMCIRDRFHAAAVQVPGLINNGVGERLEFFLIGILGGVKNDLC